jgi:outer membrane protein assembly factor BamD (BamD/ComL family)
MKKIALFISMIVLLTTACNSPSGKNEAGKKELSKSELTANINKSESELFNDKVTRIDKKKALQLAGQYKEFVNRFPDDTLSAEYLFKASDIYMNMGLPQQTVALFNKLIEKYPHYSKIATCYFLRAFVYDDQLHDYKTAEKYYKEFIKKYPDSEFTDDAKMLLKNLGKSPEELIKEFGGE